MADDETHETVVPLPAEVEITEVAMTGQPATDKAFRTASGTLFRARIVTIAQQEVRAPTSGSPRIAPAGINLSITLALLDKSLAVETDASGALIITPVHEVVWHAVSLSNPDFDAQAELARALRQQAAVLETTMAKRASITDALSDWGGSLAADPVVAIPAPVVELPAPVDEVAA